MSTQAKQGKTRRSPAERPDPRKKIRVCKFDPERTPLDILEHLLKGGTLKSAAKEIGLSMSTIDHHRRQWPILDRAIRVGSDLQRWVKDRVDRARAERATEEYEKGNQSFQDFALGRLPPDLLEVWEELDGIKDAREAEEMFTELTAGMGKRQKQRLYIQTFLTGGFSRAYACRRTGISRTCVDFWISQDAEFAALIQEVTKAQKDFVEQALMDLVALRNPQAVIFASKTLNRDRGYGETLEVTHTHRTSAEFAFDELDLSLECRREILEAIKKKKGIVDGQVIKRTELIESTLDDDYEFTEDEE